MDNDHALSLFDRARRGAGAVVVPVRLDVATLRARARRGEAHRLLRGLVPDVRRATASVQAKPDEDKLTSRLAALSAAERKRAVLDLIRTSAAIVLGHHSPSEIDIDRTFRDLGFDSLSALELRNRIGAATGLRLPATVVFDHRAPADLAAMLHAQFLPDQELAEVAVAG
jgi:acyl carrier protein